VPEIKRLLLLSWKVSQRK